MANDGSVRHSSLELLGGGSDSLSTQHSLAIGGEVVDAAGFDMGDVLASGAEGDDEVVQHESGVDTDTDSRDAVLFGEFVEFLGHVGVLGLRTGHLFGDAHDVDASGDDGAQIGDLVVDPRGCGDHADVDITIIPEIGALADEVAQAREATRAAAEATEMAARQSRAAAQHLRAAGYSVSDSAVIMGVSRGRVSQLVNL